MGVNQKTVQINSRLVLSLVSQMCAKNMTKEGLDWNAGTASVVQEYTGK